MLLDSGKFPLPGQGTSPRADVNFDHFRADSIASSPPHVVTPTKPGPNDGDAPSYRADNFNELLANNAFDAAVEQYDRIYTNHDLEFSSPYRLALLDHASRLNQDGQYAAASSLLESYLSVYYADVEALILQARVYRNDGRYLPAIKSFQQAQVNEHRQSVAGLIQNQANIIIGAYAQDLRDRDDRQAVIELYQWLTDSQPSVAGYHIGLANAYAAHQRYDEAVDALRYVQHDATMGNKARLLIEEYSAHRSRG